MRKTAFDFLKGEDGAVTVDWVVLTAGVVGLMVFTLVGVIKEPMTETTIGIGEQIARAEQFLN